MNKKKYNIVDHKKPYPPNMRDDYAPDESDLMSYSPNGDFTLLPDPTIDPIVCNNISYAEFDYTDQSIYED